MLLGIYCIFFPQICTHFGTVSGPYALYDAILLSADLCVLGHGIWAFSTALRRRILHAILRDVRKLGRQLMPAATAWLLDAILSHQPLSSL